jgi:hypothetical protein
VSWQILAGAACADVSGQENVPEPVDIELIEIILSEIQFETSVEVFDASFKLIPVEGGYRGRRLFKKFF